MYWGVNNILVILILPVVNFIVIPCFPKLTIRARMGIGLALYCTGSLTVVATHAVPFLQNRDKVSGHELGWLAIPMLIFALAEVLTTVSGIAVTTHFYYVSFLSAFTYFSVGVHICPVSREYEGAFDWALLLFPWSYFYPCFSSLLCLQDKLE